ncbi:hypothetical protein [Motilimonas eburnea]|uniref:hypothetical protein n=1 Tax=Motilimonas eburnea TaxID=1737488 RepID=UPI001E3A3A2F|nr:hypothetical protein [Motilimonas eburnea]MCE2571160.1 hypothetical protein [Motilimonas eburnea]
MKKTSLALIISSLIVAPSAFAEEDMHAFDPRNTSARVGATVNTDNGELKAFAGYGAANLYDAGEGEQTQTILFGEYFTDSDNMRARIAHFDSRFGGLYGDFFFSDYADSYTAGYMLPLETADGKTKLFPSVNYSYIDIDDSLAARDISRKTGSTEEEIHKLLLDAGAKDAHMASLNLYALHVWNDTHYTVVQAMAGQAVDGIDDLNFVDLMWVQGVQAYVKGQNINIFLEGRYHNIETDAFRNMGKQRKEDAKVSLGFDWRF